MATAVIDIANVQQVIAPSIKIPARQVLPSPVTQKQTVKQVSKEEDEAEGYNLHTEKTVEAAAEDIKAVVEFLNVSVSFSIEKRNDHPDIVIAKVIDKDTGDVIRQIPSEEIVELSKRLDEFVGIVFNKKT